VLVFDDNCVNTFVVAIVEVIDEELDDIVVDEGHVTALSLSFSPGIKLS